jgi:RNA polymerase sigma-70 factor (ECF subfamily)
VKKEAELRESIPDRANDPASRTVTQTVSSVSATTSSDDAQLPSLAEVFHSHIGFVLRSLRHMSVPEADLEDAAQEVFLIVHRRLVDFDPLGTGELRTWLFGIARNVARNEVRRAHRRHEVVSDVPHGNMEAPQEAHADRLRAARLLTELLTGLDDDKRAVFVLHDLEGVEMAAITEGLGIPLKTGYSRLRLARERIERALAARTGGTTL